MDEPLSNLDAKLRAEMRTELQDRQQRLGVTTIYVRHDQTEPMAIGDRIAVTNEGVLQQIGEQEEICRSPTNEFVSQFVGSPSIDLSDVRVGNATLRVPGEFQLADPSPVEDAGTVRLVTRPEASQTVSFEFDEESLSLFDPATGRSLKTKTGDLETGLGKYIYAE